MISPFNKFRSSSGPDNERNVARLHGHSCIAQLASRKGTVYSDRLVIATFFESDILFAI